MMWFIEWYVHSVVAQISTATLVIIGLLAAGWFLPPFRKWLWGLAGIVFAFLSAYAKGASDAKRRERQRQAEAEERMVQKGAAARRDAEHELAAGGLRDDEFDRDKG